MIFMPIKRRLEKRGAQNEGCKTQRKRRKTTRSETYYEGNSEPPSLEIILLYDYSTIEIIAVRTYYVPSYEEARPHPSCSGARKRKDILCETIPIMSK